MFMVHARSTFVGKSDVIVGFINQKWLIILIAFHLWRFFITHTLYFSELGQK